MAELDNVSYVIDSSYVLSFLLPDETVVDVNLFFKHVLSKDTVVIAPKLLNFEVINGLKSAVLQKRITMRKAMDLLDTFLSLAIEEVVQNSSHMLRISYEKGISIYDASYIALSLERGWKLLTLDKKLAVALSTYSK